MKDPKRMVGVLLFVGLFLRHIEVRAEQTDMASSCDSVIEKAVQRNNTEIHQRVQIVQTTCGAVPDIFRADCFSEGTNYISPRTELPFVEWSRRVCKITATPADRRTVPPSTTSQLLNFCYESFFQRYASFADNEKEKLRFSLDLCATRKAQDPMCFQRAAGAFSESSSRSLVARICEGGMEKKSCFVEGLRIFKFQDNVVNIEKACEKQADKFSFRRSYGTDGKVIDRETKIMEYKNECFVGKAKDLIVQGTSL